MIRDIFQNIIEQKDIRKNLIQLRQELKKDNNKHAFLYYIEGNYKNLFSLLQQDDPKVRKNTALLLGELGIEESLEYLWDAYEMEMQLFVKSSYLIAMKQFDYRIYLPAMKIKLEQYKKEPLLEESKKHILEEIHHLTDLIILMEGIESHIFIGYTQPSQLVLLTNRNYNSLILEQIKERKKKVFNAGIILKTDNLTEILPLRTYEELLFQVEGMKTCEMDIKKIAQTVVNSELLQFLEKRHEGSVPFYFRIELKSRLELEKKGVFIKKLSSEIEQLSNHNFINTTSHYEFELRLVEGKERNYNILVKLYTLKEKRFSYRKYSIATSIRPVHAALTVYLTKHYMKEGAQVLDPFCGVGTMLIERHKVVAANTTYGLDIFSEAIEKAHKNTEIAHQVIHYIKRDFFLFEHDYLFDEIITNMPFEIGKVKEKEIYNTYKNFFIQAKNHLKEDGIIILYSHNRSFVKELAPISGYRIKEEYEISKREGTYVYVLFHM